MFANLLVDEEKESYIKLLMFLSKVDDQLNDEEIDFIKKTAQEINYEGSLDFNEEIKIEEVLAGIKNSISRNVVILELVNLAFADKDYTNSEREGIRNIAVLMGVSEQRLSEIEQWVSEGVQWANKGLEIVSKEVF